MKLSQFLSSSASDSMLLNSVANYFEGKVSKAVELVSSLSDVVEHIGEAGYAPPDLSSYALSYSDGVRMVGVAPNIVRDALLQGAETISLTIGGVVKDVSVDSIIDQLSESLQTNRVMTESIHALVTSGSESAASILSDFTDRIKLTLGEVSDTVQSMASSFINVLTTTGVSVGDRVRNLLSYIGMYSFNTSEGAPEPIGLPETELSDITGSNVFQAFFAAFPDRLSQVGAWLLDTAKKIVKILEGILQTFLGSSGYRMIKKFLGTLTLQADSFAYNTGDENGINIGSHGFSCRLTGFSYVNVSWLNGLNLDTIEGNLYAINRAMGINPNPNLDLYTLLLNIQSNRLSPTLQNTPYFTLYDAIASVNYSSPSWVYNMIDSASEDTLLGLCARCFEFFNRFIRYNSYTPLGILDMVKYMLGAILDINHINDDAGYLDKLQSNNYLSIDLPCSTLYFWLVGSDILMTRRVSPCVIFMDESWASIPNKTLWRMSTAQGREWSSMRKLRITSTSLGQFFSNLRTCTEKYADTDEQMAKAVYAANIIDAVYLEMIHRGYESGMTMDDDVPEITYSNYSIAGTSTENSFKLLTGRTFTAYKQAFDNMNSTDISNLVLCQMLGVTLGVQVYSGADVTRLTNLLYYATNENYYIPYQHLTSIPAGRYRVITDKELSNVFVTLLEIAAIIVGAILVIKAAGKLKRKALAAQTKADATAWDQVVSGTYDSAAVNTQYKLQRKAALMQNLSAALFNGVGKIVQSTTTAVKSMVTATTSKLRSLVSGSVNGVETDLSLADIRKIIRGS